MPPFSALLTCRCLRAVPSAVPKFPTYIAVPAVDPYVPWQPTPVTGLLGPIGLGHLPRASSRSPQHLSTSSRRFSPLAGDRSWYCRTLSSRCRSFSAPLKTSGDRTPSLLPRLSSSHPFLFLVSATHLFPCNLRALPSLGAPDPIFPFLLPFLPLHPAGIALLRPSSHVSHSLEPPSCFSACFLCSPPLCPQVFFCFLTMRSRIYL
ncbi:unnamed protein product [Closterium sp. NIES-53]